MAQLVIEQIPALSDNYVYLAHEPDSGATACIDPGAAEPVLEALARRGWRLTHILNTHHHNDHIGGNRQLKDATGCTIIGPRADARRIPDMDAGVAEGDTVTLGRETGQVFETPGHTSGHIAFWFAGSNALFCGDTLFALGCGRLFEGTPRQMWDSLVKLRRLSGDALVYCGHEYTRSNAAFAVTVDPDNAVLRRRAEEVNRLRAEGRPTVPSTLDAERATNPFLRADDPAVQAAVGMAGADPVAVFAEIRGRKDRS